MPTDANAREVLRRYSGELACANLTPLGNAGGFSGARLPARRTGSRRLVPEGVARCVRLSHAHRFMHLAGGAGLAFVPTVVTACNHVTCVEVANRCWDLQTWMPGQPDAHPGQTRIESAAAALALLHHVWAADVQEARPCPAICRRLEAFREWTTVRGTRPPSLPPLAARAWALLMQQMDDVPKLLAPWLDMPVAVQPCLCDIWHAHVLFEGEYVSGIIDFGSVKRDHVAVDLARLLGSFAGDDCARWAVGLQAYARLRPLAAMEEALAHALDRTGVLIGLFNWIKWLYLDGRTYEDGSAVAARLGELVERVEAWR